MVAVRQFIYLTPIMIPPKKIFLCNDVKKIIRIRKETKYGCLVTDCRHYTFHLLNSTYDSTKTDFLLVQRRIRDFLDFTD